MITPLTRLKLSLKIQRIIFSLNLVLTYTSEAGVNAFFVSDLSNPEMTGAIGLADAMHIPVITPSSIDYLPPRSYLISVAYGMGDKLVSRLNFKAYTAVNHGIT